MGTNARLLAAGKGWSASDIVCTAGPRDRPYEERHGAMCIALVTDGSFKYRSTHGSAVMAPGSVLLGNVGTCFECGHEHGTGDRCLAFHFAPEFLEPIVAAVPGARQIGFSASRLAPLAALLPMIGAAQAMRDAQNHDAEFEELGMRIAGAVCVELHGAQRTGRPPSPRDERRVATALRRIEAEYHTQLSLDDLASEAAASPYHFLRIFEQVVGVTPGQYVLRTRMRHAAVRVRSSNDSISAIALDSGFGDLSTFNRYFKRLMGVTPSAFRAKSRR